MLIVRRSISSTTRVVIPAIALSKSCDKKSVLSKYGDASSQLDSLLFSGSKNSSRVVSYSEKGPSDRGLLCIVGLGDKKEMANDAELVRTAASAAVKAVRSLSKDAEITIGFTPFNGNAKATAEGAFLTTYKYTQHQKDAKPATRISPVLLEPNADSSTMDAWFEGTVLAQAQNTARHLMETPGNHMTPTKFCEFADFILHPYRDMLTVRTYDRAWAEERGMGAFLSVANGGRNGGGQEPKFLEILYRGASREGASNFDHQEFPIVLVGKGVTFDTGGISIKPSANMSLMKGDMGGAAVVLGAVQAIAKLALPINIAACIPLTENMPSGTATKPGDVIFAMNGKSIEVDNTDAEGRLILADAISYACKTYKPKSIVELSTLTGAMDVALGYPYAGVFTTSDDLWRSLDAAGKVSGEGLWRMPMDSENYKPQIKSAVADLKNVGGRGAGSCTAAVFLKEFVEEGVDFAHIDIAGVMHQGESHGFLERGMTGRPARAIVEYVKSKALK